MSCLDNSNDIAATLREEFIFINIFPLSMYEFNAIQAQLSRRVNAAASVEVEKVLHRSCTAPKSGDLLSSGRKTVSTPQRTPPASVTPGERMDGALKSPDDNILSVMQKLNSRRQRNSRVMIRRKGLMHPLHSIYPRQTSITHRSFVSSTIQ